MLLSWDFHKASRLLINIEIGGPAEYARMYEVLYFIEVRSESDAAWYLCSTHMNRYRLCFSRGLEDQRFFRVNELSLRNRSVTIAGEDA